MDYSQNANKKRTDQTKKTRKKKIDLAFFL